MAHYRQPETLQTMICDQLVVSICSCNPSVGLNTLGPYQGVLANTLLDPYRCPDNICLCIYNTVIGARQSLIKMFHRHFEDSNNCALTKQWSSW